MYAGKVDEDSFAGTRCRISCLSTDHRNSDWASESASLSGRDPFRSIGERTEAQRYQIVDASKELRLRPFSPFPRSVSDFVRSKATST